MTARPRTATTLRLSEDERRAFAAAAALTGETVASWMRRTLVEAARTKLKGSEK
jgi:uncharacterized protein (DUF1778 family)